MRHTILRRRPRRLAAASLLLVASTVLLSGARHAMADRITDQIGGKQHQRDQVGGMIAQLQGTIATLQTREGQLRAVIAQLDGRIAAQTRAVAGAVATLERLVADLGDARDRLETARARLADDRRILALQIVAVYKLGTNSAVNNLLSSENFGQFWQRYIDLKRITGGERDVVRRVHAEQDAATALVARIDHDRDAQATATARLADEERGLEATRGEQQRETEELSATEAADAEQLRLAEQSARELDAQIAALKQAEEEARRRAAGTGRFLWPLEGEITQGFGCTPYPFEPWDPSCPSRHFHSGLDIASGWGTPVLAADNGIAYDYPSSYGYGNHVIIVHGNGWVSIYGHLNRFAVDSGQAVAAGRIIGFEGSTGNSTGPHLHFEIRLNDVPRNPLQYLP